MRLWETMGGRALCSTYFFYLSPRTRVLNMDVKEILLTCVRKFVIHSQEESSHLFVAHPQQFCQRYQAVPCCQHVGGKGCQPAGPGQA